LIEYDRELKITSVFNGKIFISDLLKTRNSVKTINHAGKKVQVSQNYVNT